MFPKQRDVKISEILFDSDIEEYQCKANKKSDQEDKNLWKKNVRQYKILSASQIVALEEFFINRNLPITKTNIKWAARELKIPYQRSANYLYTKYKQAQENTGDFYQRCIGEFSTIAQNIEKCWDSYLKGCQTYDIGLSKGNKD